MNLIRGYQYQAHAVSSSHLLTVSRVLAYFEKSLKKKNNYVRVVKKYLLYCLEHHYLIDEISFKLYTAGQWPSQVTPVRKFLQFARQHNIVQVLPDSPKHALPPAANELVLAFLDDAKNLDEGSKTTYLKSLNDFFFYLEQHGGSQAGYGFSGKTVTRYLAWMKKKQLSAFTICLRLSAVKQLAAWIIAHRQKLSIELSVHQLDDLRDVAQVRGPRLERMFHKDGLPEIDRETLLSSIPDVKWQAILSLLAYEGLRTIEVTRLKVRDIDFKEMKLWVLGKGKDIKEPIRLFDACAHYLKAYLMSVPEPSAQDALFPGLNTGQIRYHTGKYLKLTGLKSDRISAHSLRHTTGQVLIAKGIDPVYVQQHLRHKDFSTTQIYVAQQTRQEYFKHLPKDL